MYSTFENGTLRVPALGVFGIVDRVHLFDLAIGVVRR